MAIREDGKETRLRLLEAACEVFAEKGYRNAKVADICQKAGANVASVNYHFGDKATLYVEAWQHAFQIKPEMDVPEPPGMPPEERLRLQIHFLIQHHTEQGAMGQFTRLYLMELASPTGLIQNVWHRLIDPRRQKLLDVIHVLLGGSACEETILFCEMSIINQCRALLTTRPDDIEYLLKQPLTPDLITRLAEHVTRFSLAGIKAVGQLPSK